MNSEIITKTARTTLEGTITFPEVVSQLLAAGVEYDPIPLASATAVESCRRSLDATARSRLTAEAAGGAPSR